MLFCASKGSAGVAVVFACTTAGELASVSITESPYINLKHCMTTLGKVTNLPTDKNSTQARF
jgi:hypothetical protein